ncbi:serine hydrolase [Flammeovirga kamogawensis]|nr:serine hydrolase [Flammeovirga kamogawensis]
MYFKKNIFSTFILITFWVSSISTKTVASDFDVDSLFSKLTLEQRIGQIIFAIPQKNDSELKALGRENKLGGVIFSQNCSKNSFTYFSNLNKLPNKVPVLIGSTSQKSINCLDPNFSLLPDNYNLSAINSNIFTFSIYQEIGKINNKLNLDIYFSNSLSIKKDKGKYGYGFGDDVINVLKNNHASIKGLHQNNILTGTTLSYDFDYKIIDDNVKNILSQLVKDNIDILKASREDFETPIFRKEFTDHLKDSLSYNGLIASGDLALGVNASLTVDNVIHALQNGHDVIALSAYYNEVIKGIVLGIKKGKVDTTLINKNVRKVLELKAKKKSYITNYTPKEDLKAIKADTYEKSVTVLNNTDSIIPLPSLNKTSYQLVSIGLKGHEDNFGNTLKMFVDYDYHRIEQPSFSTSQVNLLFESCKEKDIVIVNIVCHQESSKHRYGVSYATEQFIEQLQHKTKVIVVLHGAPDGLRYLDKSQNIIINYSTDEYAQEASAQVIAGSISGNGKLPITITPNFTVNKGEKTESVGRLGYGQPNQVGIDGNKLNYLIDSIANHAINIEATPGCQIVVAKNGKIVFEKSYGYFTYEKETPVTNQTVYDIASVTKVAATTQALMMLDYQDSINVNNSLDHYITNTDTTNKGDIKLIQFLTHTAPLKGGYYFWGHVYDREKKEYNSTYISPYKKKGFTVEVTPDLYASDTIKNAMWDWLLASPISTRRRYTKSVYRYWYSDLGYYFLQRVVEKETHTTIDKYLAKNLYEPLGTRTLGYLPLKKININRIPPTEMDINYRQCLIKGIVHDPSADLMGGVAGHAGVFSNAHDLAILMQMNLQKGTYGQHQFFDETTLNNFNRQPYTRFKNRRALGWDKPPLKGDEGNTSPLAPKSTFGHTGFTGTCAWVDPTNSIVYIFLSNRVYPTARNNKLAKENIREGIQSAIYQAMGEELPQ